MDRQITKKDIANLLKDARAKSKMSVDEVATALKAYGYEIVPKSMYNYESGTSQPPVSMFLCLCRIYGIDDLDKAMENGIKRKMEVSEREARLIKYFRAATPELQNAALRMLEPDLEDTVSSVG